MQAPPHAGRLPVAQPAPTAHAAAAFHLGRQHLPGDARAQHEQNAGQGSPIVHPGAPALRARRVGRQKRGDRSPEIVREKRASHTTPTPNRPNRAVLLGALNASRFASVSSSKLSSFRISASCIGYISQKDATMYVVNLTYEQSYDCFLAAEDD